MKTEKFKFKLSAKGRIENVQLFLENEKISIVLYANVSREYWESEVFELEYEEPLECLLKVYGVTGTGWSAELKKVIDNNEIEFLKFKGVTGEERRNISIKKSKV